MTARADRLSLRDSLRLRPVAGLLAALALVAAPARADQITTNLTGKVAAIVPSGNPNAATQLAAKGVTIGATATAKIVIESTTAGHTVSGPPYDFQQYDMAFVDIVITVGTWNVHFAPPTGLEILNFVQVADNVSNNGPVFDSWSGTALGADSDAILSAGTLSDPGTFLFLFSNIPPNASSDEGLVQDLTKYKSAAAIAFSGLSGGITFSFNGPGGGQGGDPTALARQGQMKAAGKFGHTVLKGLGQLAVAGPDKDPLGTLQDALLQDAQDAFGLQFVAAVNKALKKGGSAPLPASGKQDATTFLMKGSLALDQALTTGEDTANKDDRALRGALLKAAAAEWNADCAAQSRDAKKPSPDKLAKALAKSRATLAKVVGKALDKAAAKGVSYSGPTADAISDDVTTSVDGFVAMTKGQ